MKQVIRYRFRFADGQTSQEHMTLEEAAAKYPGWEPWTFSMRAERIA